MLFSSSNFTHYQSFMPIQMSTHPGFPHAQFFLFYVHTPQCHLADQSSLHGGHFEYPILLQPPVNIQCLPADLPDFLLNCWLIHCYKTPEKYIPHNALLTAVATMMGLSPLLNSLRASSRSFWERSP